MVERVRLSVDSVKYKEVKEYPNGAALNFVVDVIKALDKTTHPKLSRTRSSAQAL